MNLELYNVKNDTISDSVDPRTMQLVSYLKISDTFASKFRSICIRFEIKTMAGLMVNISLKVTKGSFPNFASNINPFNASVALVLKLSENHKFSDDFRGNRS